MLYLGGLYLKNITADIVQQFIPKRKEDSYKGTYGKVLVIGGDQNMGGATMLTASAAVYSGAGLVTVATDPKNHTALHARLPEAMVLDLWDAKSLEEQIKKVDIVVMGPGLGLSEQAAEVVELVFQHIHKEQQLILDGSAISLVAQESLSLPETHLTFTPHAGEWKKLSGISKEDQTVEKNKQAQKKLDATIVLKGSRTEIYFCNDDWKNTTGNPAMATGGMGDTLAGMIAGFTAQLPDKEQATLAAVYLHSYIGDALADQQYVVLPSQIIEAIPSFMKNFEQQRL